MWRSSILSVTLVFLLASGGLAGAEKPESSLQRIERVIAAQRDRLGISANVGVKLTESNPLVVSVEPVDGGKDAFLVSLDPAFLSQLDEDDLTAAMAHELGHVWIYTHHPFLQTEALANQIAMRIVPRDTLKKLYGKLWAFQNTTGNMDELLGPEGHDSLQQN